MKETIHQILSVTSFIAVAYLLGRVFSLERQIKAMNWMIGRHYQWLEIHSIDIAGLKSDAEAE